MTTTSTTWNVHIAHRVHGFMPDDIDGVAIALEQWDAAASLLDGVLHVDLSLSASDPAAAVQQALLEVAASAGDGAMLLAVEVRTDEALAAELDRPQIPDLAGGKEVAELLGVSKQRLHQLTGREDFPNPILRLASGPVWLVESIRAFERGWSRRPGRPSLAAAALAVSTTSDAYRVQDDDVTLIGVQSLDSTWSTTEKDEPRDPGLAAATRERTLSKSNDNDRHVVKRDDGWAVVKEDAKRASAVVSTQKEAINRAREIVDRAGGGELTIHGKDGKIRAKDTIVKGNDPRDIPG